MDGTQSGSPAHAIEIEGVRKTYGSVRAVDRLDLLVRAGGVTGFLGPNGSGKTSTLRMILSILLPDEGEIRVLGRSSALESRPRIGYLPEDRGLYKETTVSGFLWYFARLKGMARSGLTERISTWLERVELGDKAKAKCGTLSRGMQQKVQALAALIHEPDLLILDEPFSGLDPLNRRLISNLFLEQQRERGATLMLSTHILQHAEELCDHVVMMHQGRKVLDGKMAEVRRSHSGGLLWEPRDQGLDLAPVDALPGVAKATRAADGIRITPSDGTDPSALIPVLGAHAPTERIGLEQASLESVFLQCVAASSEDG